MILRKPILNKKKKNVLVMPILLHTCLRNSTYHHHSLLFFLLLPIQYSNCNTASLITPSIQPDANEPNLEGSAIGNYRVIEKIGSGGMGSVYRGERADGAFERQVAIKVVKQGMNTEAVATRFQQERAILARLDHANIAGVLDGGITEDGRPYFIMEYVDGEPITDYCDSQGLNVNERLRIFKDVCLAVQYAHQNLVVHRDLKPSNILVSASGVPKLLDFGIAKLLEQNNDAELTQTGVLLATPAYAAPEQLTSGSITTMTDVYALGVLLYELLIGRRPFETKRTPEEYLLTVLQDEPLRPSTAISQQPVSEGENQAARMKTIAAARGVETTKLRAVIRGDLDNICLMAITREPALRYPTAGALAEDITLHLSGKPISARRQNFSYRARKFYTRHTVGVMTAIAGFLLLVTFAFYHTNRITIERDIAIEEQAKTEQVVQFVTGLFLAADPAQARGTQISARELLDTGRRQIETEMANRPAVQATLKRVLGKVYYELGEQEVASSLLQSALATQLDIYGPQHLETASTWLSLGAQQQTVGQLEPARESLLQALKIRQKLLGNTHVDVMQAISAQAFFEETVGDYDSAEKLHLQALAMARSLATQPQDLGVATQMGKLASLLRLQDRLDEAEVLLRNSLTMQNQLYGGEHPESDESKRQLAELLTDRRKFDQAEDLFNQLIASRTKMLGPDHFETGAAWNSYGHLLSAKGDRAGAIDAYTKMLDITRKSYGDTHPALAAGYNNVAIIKRNMGDLPGALEDFQSSLLMQDAVGLDTDHPNRAYPISGQARIYLLMRRFTDALVTVEKAMTIRRKQFEENHILLVELRSDLGAIQSEMGNYNEAEANLLFAYENLVQDWDADDPRIGLTAGRLLRHYELTNQPQAAQTYKNVATAQKDDIMLQYY